MSDPWAEIDAHLGLTRGTESELDRMAGRAFGRASREEEKLLDELCKVGMTRAGARGVVSWADDGLPVEEAAALVSGAQVLPGKVRQMVIGRAAEVLRRHRGAGPVNARDAAGSGRPVDRGSGRVAEARERLVAARRAEFASVTAEQAGVYADAVVSGLNERALREGLSEDQVLEVIEQHLVHVRKRAAEPRSTPPPRATTKGTIRETTRSPIRRN